MPESLLAIAHALMDAVEAMPEASSGAFVVSRHGKNRGLVLAEGGRVCWASAIGLEHRFRALMWEYAGKRLDRGDLSQLTPHVARAVLRQHSIESLTELCGDTDVTIGWTPRSEPLHGPGSFAPTELLAAVGARLYPSEAARASSASIHPDGTAGADFVIGDDGDLVVVREVGGARLGVTPLYELGVWAAAALDATPGFSSQMITRALESADASVAVGWRSGRRVVHATIIDDRETLTDALTAMRRQDFPVVVSVRVPWKLKESTTTPGLGPT